jgi:enamine deaminase RidA (YjgF/YER057c/UK114 family)
MKRRNFAGNSPWEPLAGYSRAVRAGPHVWVSGTTATDADGSLVGPGNAAIQAGQALANIRRALEAAGARLEDVVRTRLYVTRIEDAEAVARVHAEFFGDIRPAATLVEVGRLVDPVMLVEIEADAFVAD